MEQNSKYYIGIMSGTSMDGIDVAIVDFSNTAPKLIAAECFPWDQNIAKQMNKLCLPGDNEIEICGDITYQISKSYAYAVNTILKNNHICSDEIIAIGNHGQTIRHRPERFFSVQIADNALLSYLTSIDTIGDFRSMDIACGGQGAPLVPAFHNDIFYKKNIIRIILNIGGIANISVLNGYNQTIIGYDTGPGNTLIDQNCNFYWNKPFDKNGEFASKGIVNNELLEIMLSHPYLQKTYPKSTGREVFTYDWVSQCIKNLDINKYDLQRTLTFFTAKTISDEILKFTNNKNYEVYVCGGGVYNKVILNDLKNLLVNCQCLESTNALGVDPNYVEAMAFAWLAKQYTENKPSNLPVVTGANCYAVLGCKYIAPKKTKDRINQ